MNFTRFFIYAIMIVLGTMAGFAQGTGKSTLSREIADDTRHIRSSPAYAEILLRKTELEAELESLLLDYTEDYPKIKDIRLELELLKTETERLKAVKPTEAGKLTLALGKLILGKVSHLATLRRLQLQYKDEHPSVRKEKRMVEVYEAAIKDILG